MKKRRVIVHEPRATGAVVSFWEVVKINLLCLLYILYLSVLFESKVHISCYEMYEMHIERWSCADV